MWIVLVAGRTELRIHDWGNMSNMTSSPSTNVERAIFGNVFDDRRIIFMRDSIIEEQSCSDDDVLGCDSSRRYTVDI